MMLFLIAAGWAVDGILQKSGEGLFATEIGVDIVVTTNVLVAEVHIWKLVETCVHWKSARKNGIFFCLVEIYYFEWDVQFLNHFYNSGSLQMNLTTVGLAKDANLTILEVTLFEGVD